MEHRLSRRARMVEDSPTLAMNARTQEMVRQGIDIISFTVGEPDFNTPAHIGQAGIAAIKEGFTRYTAAAGIPQLRQAVVEKLARDHGLSYNMNQVVISTGAKQALANALQALADDGDEVIIPAPYWVSYGELVKLAGATPVIVDTREEDDFKITPQQLEENITENTVALLLNNPNNPTGTVYGKEDLQGLAEVLREHPQVYVISDDVYEKLIYDGEEFFTMAQLDEEMKHRTVVINGVSKSYAMTGWRLGYAAADLEIAQAMGKIQSHITSGTSSISQKAALAALKGDQQPMLAMVEEFVRRRDYMYPAIKEIPGLSCIYPRGAFYIFTNISSYFGRTIKGKKITGSLSFAEALLTEGKVSAVPGIAFGADNYIRFSYATSLENIKEGVRRLADFLAQAK
ncbi:MAG: pyridoxal phosphate-dependent aminotransferase [Firmicutes bacterium]|nr:pyridoxal phosphate-dependent aminotransferase [Bacillota bacterium]